VTGTAEYKTASLEDYSQPNQPWSVNL